MQPLKILHVIPSLKGGGAERQLVELVSGTAADDFFHKICVLTKGDFFAPLVRQAGQEIVELDMSGKRPWLKAANKINSMIRSEKPDIIHSWLYDANIVSRLVRLRNKGIPLVTSLQAPDYDPDTIKALNWPPAKMEVLRWIDKTLAMLTSPHFVACSEFVAGSYRKKLGIAPEKMSVIYNSVSAAALNAAPGEAGKVRGSLGIAKDEFIFLHVGRLDPQKDHATLLRAFQKVSAEVPSAYLVLIGTGGLGNSLKELAASLQITENVRFLGKREDVGACLEMADCYVFPSLAEGLPLALLEAMAKGLPCVVSDIDPHREVIDDGVSGLMIKPGSVDTLADTMIRIYNDSELRGSLGREAYKKVSENFFTSVLIPQWEDLYRKLASR